MSKAKPYCISKMEVFHAYQAVKENKGAAGIDKVSLKDFEQDYKNNLYKIWNRMSSGSYFPLPVRKVEIPKAKDKKRILGIPTVSDRIAQMVVKRQLEPIVEKIFHENSYGYRPNKSALDAVGKARERCWKYDWVLDLDIKGFFDNIDHQLMMQMLEKHTDCRWVLLYAKRWLEAPMQKEDGSIEERSKGTPQGGVISPILANIFLHHAFDEWMKRKYPSIPFERYADDIICHCKSLKQALMLKGMIERRLAEYKLELNPEKTRIAYCKSSGRKGDYPQVTFDFLGYTFRPRKTKNKSGEIFQGFNPGVSKNAATRMRERIRKWNLHLITSQNLDYLAKMINPTVRGWFNYYGKYFKSELWSIINHLNARLIKWIMKKYRKSNKKAVEHLNRARRKVPELFFHWSFTKGRMMGAV